MNDINFTDEPQTCPACGGTGAEILICPDCTAKGLSCSACATCHTRGSLKLGNCCLCKAQTTVSIALFNIFTMAQNMMKDPHSSHPNSPFHDVLSYWYLRDKIRADWDYLDCSLGCGVRLWSKDGTLLATFIRIGWYLPSPRTWVLTLILSDLLPHMNINELQDMVHRINVTQWILERREMEKSKV